ncbi:hypothetical protein [Microlunatus soli]|nr:hypothetical protein [Microlunatus soli]
MTAVRGTVSATFDDEVIGVIIGGAAVQLELDAPPPPDAVGRLVVLTVDDLEFHPTGL